MTTVNNKFKDGVFCRLFGSAEYKENLLSLFNALNGTNYENTDELKINTIDDAIFMGIKNDSSCILDACQVLKEYALFVECSRRHLQKSPKNRESKIQAMLEAVNECISNGILVDFLLKNKSGVVDMYIT